MNMRTISVATALVLVFAGGSECTAGPWGKVIRESVEAVTKRSGKAAREGVEAAAKKGGSRAGSKSAIRGARIVRASDDVAARVVGRFGDDGARALKSLSPTGAQRLAAMSDELAASGRGGDWMKLISQRGDEVTDWLWRRRGSVAVGTLATAVVLQPEDFLEASEKIATTTLTHIAAPLVKSAASAVPWALIGTFFIGTIVLWVLVKRGLAALGIRLLASCFQGVTSVTRKATPGSGGAKREI